MVQVLGLEFESALFDLVLNPLQLACCNTFATLSYETNGPVKANTLSDFLSQS